MAPAPARIRIIGNQFFLAALVFLLALTLRIWHNESLQYRVWFFQDAQNYLYSGHALLKLVWAAPGEIIPRLLADASGYSGEFNALTSRKLVDRLSIDGPIFPLYLAFGQFLAGLDIENPQFAKIASTMSIINSLMDCLTCLMIFFICKFSFSGSSISADRQNLAAFLSGALAALYPGLIVNTQWCMSENFSAFIIAFWLLSLILLVRSILRAQSRPIELILLSIAQGALLAVAALTKPIFLYLPIVMLLLLSLIPLFNGNSSIPLSAKKLFASPVFQLVACSVIMSYALLSAPWLLYTNLAYGRATLGVQRAPIYNLVAGNMGRDDGWISLPHETVIPASTSGALQYLIDEGIKSPRDLMLLLGKKPSRLWSGVWNDTASKVLGIPSRIQDLIHQFLLLLAFGWLFCLTRKGFMAKEPLRATINSAALAVIVLHSLYLAASTLTRYNLSALPAIVILSGSTLAWLFMERKSAARTLSGLILSILALWALNELGPIYRLMLGHSGELSNQVLLWAIALLATALASAMIFFLARALDADFDYRPVKLLLLSAITICSICSFAGLAGDRAARQWCTPLQSGQSIGLHIETPADPHNYEDTGLLLVDLQESEPGRKFRLSINDKSIESAVIPLYTIQSDNDEIMQGIKYQARMTGKDFRSFRDWQAIPFPLSSLRPGEKNRITLSPINALEKNIPQAFVFGDYPSNFPKTTEERLPCHYSHSWHKAVNNSERQAPLDARVYRLQAKQKRSKVEFYDGKQWQTEDLSSIAGKQRGNYRILVLLRPKTNLGAPNHSNWPQYEKASTEIILERPQEKMITGADPMTMFPAGADIEWNGPLEPDTWLVFESDLKGLASNDSAFITVTVTGDEHESWTSSWSPSCIPLTKNDWKRVILRDHPPASILASEKISIKVMVSPFHEDLIFAKPKEASKKRIYLANCRLSLERGPVIEREDLRKWHLF